MGYALRWVREREQVPYGTDAEGACAEGAGAGDETEAREAPAAGPAGPGRRARGSLAREFAALDVEAIETLGDEIALWAANLSAARHHLLTLIARFHALGGWKLGGHRDCADWLVMRTGMSRVTAREHVRVALALAELPETSAAMERGELSFCKARAVTRVARPETEPEILAFATGATTKQLEMYVRAWRKHSRLEEAELERERLRARRLTIVPGELGMYEMRGLLTAEGGTLAMRGIEQVADELYRAERASGLAPEDDTQAAAARRRADAMVQLIERGMAVTRSAGAQAEAEDRAVSGTRAERYRVVLHTEPAALAEDGEPGLSEFEDGTRVSYETARRLACDASVVRVERSATGEVLNVGRSRRTITTSIRRALEVRDRGCRFPGCGIRFTEGHHVDHWTDGGETSAKNGILLCRYHHLLVHEGGWTLQWWPRGRAAFTDPRGQVHVGGEVPKTPELADDPPAELLRRNRARGAPEPDAWTAAARWTRERDIPDAVLFRAGEAVMG